MYVINRTYLPKNKAEFLHFAFQYKIMINYYYFVQTKLKSLANIIYKKNTTALINKSTGTCSDRENYLIGGLKQIIRNSEWKYFSKKEINCYSPVQLKRIATVIQERLN